MDVHLVSCLRLPEPDPDAEPLAAALAARGIAAVTRGWDDPSVDWSAAPLTVLRSSWNYPHDIGAFRRWIDAAAERTTLCNPPAVLRWNLHKSYLLDLAGRGVATTPTAVVRRGEGTTVAGLRRVHGWNETVVIKPAESAASFATRRFAPAAGPLAEQHLRELAARRDVLVQPFLASVETHGERALIWIDGELTHAVRKAPRFAGESEAVSPTAVPIAADEAALARAALDAVAALAAAPLLYARIDVAPGPTGEPMLMELELVEPSLFFVQSPAALDRFVGAVERRLAALRSLQPTV